MRCTGLLYMCNHRPKFENFLLWDDNNMIGGDWRREGTQIKKIEQSSAISAAESYPTVFAKSLTPNTIYIKMAVLILIISQELIPY